jgi:hypothetical protein
VAAAAAAAAEPDLHDEALHASQRAQRKEDGHPRSNFGVRGLGGLARARVASQADLPA